MQHLEEKIAHLMRAVDDLSEVTAKQDATIAMLNRRVQLLMEREAERESELAGAVSIGERRPPHW